MRVNGLYGHVRRNDTRSLLLFAAFVAAFQVLALLSLLVPLAMLDAGHAPLSAPLGYLTRWVPLVALLGMALFAVQLAWHVRHVRVKTAFRFVDDGDEPRLCRIVEPLAIAAGLPTPYVAVIDSPALNAFACGIRRKDAVLVFTRGLIDGLDDEELGAVAAHEISHVVHGDIRLIAAANVCLDSLRLVAPREPKDHQRLGYYLTMPVVMFVAPMLFVLVLVVCVVRKLAVDASHLTRLLIASSREFIADAEAVRLTQNPAALVAALRRIEGRSAIPGLAAGQDAMMIDGTHEGAMATHPTIGERVRAITAVTGAMALIAPSRRDTRPAEVGAGGGFGRRRSTPWVPSTTAAAEVGGPARVAGPDHLNRLGMTREMTLGAVAASVLFLAVHAGDLDRPRALAAAFDPTPMNAFLGFAGQGARCEWNGMARLMTQQPTTTPVSCRQTSMQKALAPFKNQRNLLGVLANGAGLKDGEYEYPDGTISNVPPPAVQAAQVRAQRCFPTEDYITGDWMGHPTSTLAQFLQIADSDALAVRLATPGREDGSLRAYVADRQMLWEQIHRSYGEPGIAAAAATYAGEDHRHAVARLAERLRDPRFTNATTPLDLAEMQLLTANPDDFISCIARRDRPRPRIATKG